MRIVVRVRYWSLDKKDLQNLVRALPEIVYDALNAARMVPSNFTYEDVHVYVEEGSKLDIHGLTHPCSASICVEKFGRAFVWPTLVREKIRAEVSRRWPHIAIMIETSRDGS